MTKPSAHVYSIVSSSERKITAHPVFFLRVVQYGCVLHMREMLMTLFLSLNPTCWRSNVFLYLSVNKYTDCFSVYLTVTYYLFILTTHKSLYTYVIFLHNLFYNIVLWYTLLYNKLFISLMWFVCIINCYYVIIFFVEENPNKVMLRVIIYLYVSFLFPCRRS